MLDHKMTTQYAELVRLEALRNKSLAQLRPNEPAYEDLYYALGFAAMCVEKELTDADW